MRTWTESLQGVRTPRRVDPGWFVEATSALLASCFLLLPAGSLARDLPIPLLLDRSSASGVDFVHDAGAAGERFPWEILGGGAALGDFDNDGDLDLYTVQGAAACAGGRPLGGGTGDRLYRNDTVPGETFRFTDVSETAGLGCLPEMPGYQGMGVAVGDVDGDHDLDLYVTAHGPNRLLVNGGNGRFEDRTAASGLHLPTWSTAATFFDADGDHDLDLFVAGYVEASVDDPRRCFSETGHPDYCGPLAYPAEADRLFLNRGDGTFEDATGRSGLDAVDPAPGLGVVAADLTGDGLPDLYVANDQTPNHFWVNQGDGTFEEQAIPAGCAVSGEGRPEASMGVDAADLDGDGDLDLVLTHLDGETDTVYENLGDGLFADATSRTGLGPPGLPFTSFGVRAVDLDLDGHLDLPVVSGAIREIDAQRRAGSPLPLAQPARVFRNLGGGRFEDTTRDWAPTLSQPAVFRALAVGDLDHDGDSDLVVTRIDASPLLLENRAADDGSRSWIGLDLDGATGARVEAVLASGRRLQRRAATDRGYLSAHDPRVVFPMDPSDPVREIRVRWGDGSEEVVGGWEVGGYGAVRRAESPRKAKSPSDSPFSKGGAPPHHHPNFSQPMREELPPFGKGRTEEGFSITPETVPDPHARRQMEERRRWLEPIFSDENLPATDRARALGELGLLYHAYELLGPAESFYRAAWALDPSSSDWPYYLGRIANDRGRLEEAVKFFGGARERAPKDVAVRVRLAEALADLGWTDEAVEVLDEALELDPSSAAAHVQRGRLDLSRSRAPRALAHFDSALERQPEATSVYALKSRALASMGRMEEARSAARQAGFLAVALDDPRMSKLAALSTGQRLWINQGIDALEAGHPEDAARSFARAVAADPLSSRPRAYLATVLARLGRLEEARKHMDVALRLAPDEPEVLQHAAYVQSNPGGPAFRPFQSWFYSIPNR